ncbi:MAG: HesA/MoeB/ThiF family protein [Nanoarchaeota archaeon]|nr:HesA/MoeB/ThiF family protein [Nanoarchaeota archaeon]
MTRQQNPGSEPQKKVFLRYSRQELVIGKNGQKKLAHSSVAVLGVGALGTAASELLARAGVGKLILVDRDVVEETNLQRQTLFSEKDVGTPKAEAAAHRLSEINSNIKIDYLVADVNYKTIASYLGSSDLILDCTDNLHTRFLLNEYCRKNKKSWVHAAAIRQEGNVMLVTPSTPCFRCTFGEAKHLETCDTAGVLGTTTALIGALQAHLALLYLIGERSPQELIHLHLDSLKMHAIATKKNPACPVCEGTYEYLDGKKETKHLENVCSGTYTLFVKGVDLSLLEKRLKKIGAVKRGRGYLFFGNLSVFESGKILVKAKSLAEAKSLVARYVGA